MALYHIHRPQTFADILGQDHIKTTLREQVKSDKVAHAYLFSGPRGVGKTSTARILAKALNAGIDKKGEILDNDIAKSITEGTTIDVIEIDAASHTGVDNVREQIIENAQFRPTTLYKKVFIIDEVHMLSTSAFNALLKILEEPPSYVLFVLATTEPHKLPATIISRCQRFEFRPIPYDVLFAHLEKIATDAGVTVSEDVLGRIVNKSDGCARDAVSLLDQVMSIGKTTIEAEDVQMILPVSNIDSIHTFVAALLEKDQTTALSQIQTEVSEGMHMGQFGRDIVEYLRYLMIAKAGSDIAAIAPDLSPASIDALQALTKRISYAEIITLLDTTMQRVREIPRAPIPQLPLEMLVIWWCDGAGTTTKQTKQTVATPPVAKKEATQTPKPAKTETTPPPPIEETVEAEATPKPVQQETPAPTPTVERTPGAVSKHWNKIVETVEATSPSLVFILKMATVEAEEGTAVTIGVQYSFHKDKLLGAEAKQTIENALSTILGDTWSIEVTVIGPDTSTSPDAALQDLAAAFGGEVVS